MAKRNKKLKLSSPSFKAVLMLVLGSISIIITFSAALLAALAQTSKFFTAYFLVLTFLSVVFTVVGYMGYREKANEEKSMKTE